MSGSDTVTGIAMNRTTTGRAPGPATPREDRMLHRTIVGLLLIATLGLLAYSNTLHVPFVFDDEPAITENRLVKDIGNFLANLDGYAYNPRRYIAYLTFAINHRIDGLDVTGYHAFNIIVHLVNAFLVFALVRLSFRTPFLKKSALFPFSLQIAFFSALLFAVHPVQTQAVTYIVQRMTSLATLFSLASVCLYSRWRLAPESENSVWNRSLILYASSLLSLVLAMKTKEIAFTVPILITLYESFFFESTRWRYLVPVLLTLLIIPAGLLNIGKPLGEILSDVSTVTRVKSALPRGVYLLTEVAVVATYLRLLVFPVNQNLDYDYPVVHSVLNVSFLLAATIILALLFCGTILFLRSRPDRGNPIREFRLASYGVAWFFITLLVESSIIPITDVIFEHRAYLPSAGFFIGLSTIIIAAGFRLESKVPGLRRALVAGMTLAAIVLTVATFARNETWKDEVRLWTDVVAKSPRKGRPRYNLGLAYERKGDLDEAKSNYITSISLDPYNGKAHDNLGTIFAKQGSLPEAIREFRTALALDPDDAAAMNNLGNIYANLGRLEDALLMFRKTLASDPDNVDAFYNLGIVYGKTGDFEKAAEAYSAALRLDPGHVAAHNNLGLLYARQGRLVEAAAEFRAAVTLAPSDAEAWNNLGIVFATQGKYEEATQHFIEAQRWSPENAEVRYNAGMAYRALGRFTDAMREFRAALQIDPGHAGARRKLAEVQGMVSGDP